MQMLACVISVHAEGIPVDHKTGRIEFPHTVVTLTADQIEETQSLGTFTLTSDQWKGLRKIAPRTPKRFQNIIPVTYDDCCCGMEGPYVIAISKDRMAVLHEGEGPVGVEEIRYQLFVSQRVVTFVVNERGEFHLNGTLVPFPVVLSALSAALPDAKRDKDGNLMVTVQEYGESFTTRRAIDVELPMGAKLTDAVYATRLKQVADTAKQTGFWVLYAAEESE